MPYWIEVPRTIEPSAAIARAAVVPSTNWGTPPDDPKETSAVPAVPKVVSGVPSASNRATFNPS